MSGSSSVTVPGSSGSIVTVAAGTGDVLRLAQEIGAFLSASSIAGGLNVVSDSTPGAIAAPTLSGSQSASELVLSGAGPFDETIPGGLTGYQYVVNTATAPIDADGCQR